MRILSEHFPKSPAVDADGLRACLLAFSKTLSVQQVLLFGSYARGQNHLGSDVDLCLIIRDSQSQQSAARALRRSIGRIRNKPALSLIPISTSRLAEKKQVNDPFFATILREGVCLAEED